MLKPLGHKKIIENELEGFGIRLNSKPPNIGFKKKDKGGINLTATVSWKFFLTKPNKWVKAVCWPCSLDYMSFSFNTESLKTQKYP